MWIQEYVLFDKISDLCVIFQVFFGYDLINHIMICDKYFQCTVTFGLFIKVILWLNLNMYGILFFVIFGACQCILCLMK